MTGSSLIIENNAGLSQLPVKGVRLVEVNPEQSANEGGLGTVEGGSKKWKLKRTGSRSRKG